MRAGKPLEGDPLGRHAEPVLQEDVVGKQRRELGVDRGDVGRIARERRPAERADPSAEQRAHVRGHEARVRKRIGVAAASMPRRAGCCRSRTRESRRPGTRPSPSHGRRSTVRRARGTASGRSRPQRGRLLEGHLGGDVTRQRIVRRGLVGDEVEGDSPGNQLREDVGRIAEQPDRERPTCSDAAAGSRAIASSSSSACSSRYRVSSRRSSERWSTSTQRQAAPAIVAASGCAPPMPPSPAVSTVRPARSGDAEVLLACGAERLVGALQDALRSDVDPRARRHLPEHRQTLCLEPTELVPRSPRQARAASWRSGPVGRRRASGRRRPACPTGRAASRRLRSRSSVATIARRASCERAALPDPP